MPHTSTVDVFQSVPNVFESGNSTISTCIEMAHYLCSKLLEEYKESLNRKVASRTGLPSGLTEALKELARNNIDNSKARAALVRVTLQAVKSNPDIVVDKLPLKDRVLLSDVCWAAFESDISAADSREYAERSVDVSLANEMPADRVETYLSRLAILVAWMATDPADVEAKFDERISLLHSSHRDFGEQANATARHRDRCKAMAGIKLCCVDCNPPKNVLAQLDHLLASTLVHERLDKSFVEVRDELSHGVSTAMKIDQPGSVFLAVQLLRQWNALTHPTQRVRAEFFERYALLKKRVLQALEGSFLVEHDLIGLIEFEFELAELYCDGLLHDTAWATLEDVSDSYFTNAKLPPKAVYKAVFLARWQAATGRCLDTKTDELIRQNLAGAKETASFRSTLWAQPFALLRYGLNYHFQGLFVDLASAGVSREDPEITELRGWFGRHCAGAFASIPESDWLETE